MEEEELLNLLRQANRAGARGMMVQGVYEKSASEYPRYALVLLKAPIQSATEKNWWEE